jgi:choline dehydrogenase-like flavoprotein
MAQRSPQLLLVAESRSSAIESTWTARKNFWSLFKRTLKETYVTVDPVHLNRYLDEQTFRFNERDDNDGGRFRKVVLKSPLAGALPDVQLLFAAAPQAATPYMRPFTRPYADSFGCRAVVLRPESRGRLDLVSADPRQPMRIRQNFLATDKDWATLRAIDDVGQRLAGRNRWGCPYQERLIVKLVDLNEQTGEFRAVNVGI